MKTITWGLYYWPYYLILTGATFLIPEIIALITNANNTLSDYSWRELHVGGAFSHTQHTAAWWISIVAWALAVIVLTAHIWFKDIP